MNLPTNFNYQKSLVFCVILFFFGIIFGFIMFPKILRMGLQKVSVYTVSWVLLFIILLPL